jgi:glycogenin glucosyltransferase
LTQFAKIVFLDADTLVLTNVDDLFQYEEFSACSDIGWPDCFNSGVFVARPSAETFQRLIEFGESNGSFDGTHTFVSAEYTYSNINSIKHFVGGDQGLLNEYFADWKRLPFVYNVTPSATYSYAPAYKKYQKDIRIAHFIGVDKPWRWERYSDGTVMPRGRLAEASGLVQFWWNVHDRHIGKWVSAVYFDIIIC